MTSRLKTLIAAAGLAVGLSASASQASTLVGTFGGNDPYPDPLVLADFGINTPALAKCDNAESLSCTWEQTGLASGTFDVTFNDEFSGSWSYSGGALYPAYLAVKASSQWALYALDNSFGGDWSTADLLNPGGNQPGISHLSFYDSAAPIPLPAAGWMLIAGLGGLGMAARRRRRAA